MKEVIFHEDVREVYWANTTEYNVEINGTDYKLRVAEDSNGSEDLMFDGSTWINEGFPEEVQLFFENVAMGEIDRDGCEGDVIELQTEF